jgi:hypothetical protein
VMNIATVIRQKQRAREKSIAQEIISVSGV